MKSQEHVPHTSETEEKTWSRTLAEKIIQETHQLGRPLDTFDTDSLASTIHESLQELKRKSSP